MILAICAPLTIRGETRIARLVARENQRGHFAHDLQQSDVLDSKNPVVTTDRLLPATYATMPVQQSDLRSIRERFGRIEGWWRKHFGYGFEGLTASEARTILTYDKGRLSPD